jgi:hypothetical protein
MIECRGLLYFMPDCGEARLLVQEGKKQERDACLELPYGDAKLAAFSDANARYVLATIIRLAKPFIGSAG